MAKDYSLEEFLEKEVFADVDTSIIFPMEKDVTGFNVFLERYKKGLKIESSAVSCFE